MRLGTCVYNESLDHKPLINVMCHTARVRRVKRTCSNIGKASLGNSWATGNIEMHPITGAISQQALSPFDVRMPSREMTSQKRFFRATESTCPTCCPYKKYRTSERLLLHFHIHKNNIKYGTGEIII
jgi:hypothetical protein